MVKKFHELSIETFVQATEDEAKVMTSIFNLLGREIGDIERSETQGVHHNPITVVTVRVKREREIEKILSFWKDLHFWSEALKEPEMRMDEGLIFHVRVEKDSAFYQDPVLWKKGESIQIRLKVASYPASFEKAMKVIEGL